MNCFLCNTNNLLSLYALVVHFKVYHGLRPDSAYECKHNTCNQSFPNLSSFKKHVNNKHNLQNNATNVNAQTYVNKENHLEIHSNVSEKSNAEKECVQNTNSQVIDFPKVVQSLQRSSVMFLLNLHNNSNFTRSNVIQIQNGVETHILQPFSKIFDSIYDAIETNETQQNILQNLSLQPLNMFHFCRSEHRLKDWLHQNNFLGNIQEFTIHNEIRPIHHNGENVYDQKQFKGVLLPLKFQFKKIFEKDDNFENAMSKLNILSHESSLEHFIQGKLWKQKLSTYTNKIVFPYFLYLDDFETNNPLGSHSGVQSMCGFYYSFPLLENSSKLDNIYVAAFIKSTYLKQFGNELSLKCLIDQLNSLAIDGIQIETKTGAYHVYFVLGLILGDNLGLNSILDFSKSFSANFFCRFCKVNKSDAQELTDENVCLLRNRNNYKQDVELNDFSCTGIYKESQLNQIKSFHVTENYSVDLMHDLFEGICHYDICEILNYYIEEKKIFSLETFNRRKQQFNYGILEISNLSPPIKPADLKKNHLKMSAREMITFVHFLPLIIGDLVPENDSVWGFFLNLLKICDLLLSYKFTTSSKLNLKALITVHNSQYQSLFNKQLKPKYHILEHYPTIILFSGPPRHFWSMRFEAKHKEMKMYARATTCRKNMSLTLARKYELRLANFLISPTPNDLLLSSNHIIKMANKTLISKMMNMPEHSFDCYKQVKYKGQLYKHNFLISKFTDKISFFQIDEIIVINKDLKIKFSPKKIRIGVFNKHYNSYELYINDSTKELLVINNDNFTGPPITHVQMSNGQYFVRPKEYFSPSEHPESHVI